MQLPVAKQTIAGKFQLRLQGIPFLVAVGKRSLISRKGNQAGGRAILIGPFLFGLAGPKSKKRTRVHSEQPDLPTPKT